MKLRPGNAGSNTVRDHLEVLTESIRQTPAAFRRDPLITCDGAGSTHDLIDHITALNQAAGRKVHYSVGFDFDGRAKAVLPLVPENAWQHALDEAGAARPLREAAVVELTGLLRQSAGGDRLPAIRRSWTVCAHTFPLLFPFSSLPWQAAARLPRR